MPVVGPDAFLAVHTPTCPVAVAARAVVLGDLSLLESEPGEAVRRPMARPEFAEMSRALGRWVPDRERRLWRIVATVTAGRYQREVWRGRRHVVTVVTVPGRDMAGTR